MRLSGTAAPWLNALRPADASDLSAAIADEDRPQIFSPCYRNQHAWRVDSAGHGLGLAMVARCAKLMDAKLGFQSRLGHGSRFWLRLPVHAPPAHRPAPAVQTLTSLPPRGLLRPAPALGRKRVRDPHGGIGPMPSSRRRHGQW